MHKCPKCGSPRVHRSRSRGLVEQLRKTVSSKRPHRCHACGWRGWGVATQEPAEPEDILRVRAAPDLHVIDTVISGVVVGRRSESRGSRKSKSTGKPRKSK